MQTTSIAMKMISAMVKSIFARAHRHLFTNSLHERNQNRITASDWRHVSAFVYQINDLNVLTPPLIPMIWECCSSEDAFRWEFQCKLQHSTHLVSSKIIPAAAADNPCSSMCYFPLSIELAYIHNLAEIVCCSIFRLLHSPYTGPYILPPHLHLHFCRGLDS